MLSASPELFRDDPHQSGQAATDRLQDWTEAHRNGLHHQYGDRIVRAQLHLDEATPHIHAYLVPLDDRGQLNCTSLFGQCQQLSEFQSHYHADVAHLGLERGEQGSRARHEDIKRSMSRSTRVWD